MTEKGKPEKETTTTEDQSSKVWSDVKKGLKIFGAAAAEKAEELGKLASDKAEELTKVGKLKLDILQLKRNRSKEIAELGEITYELIKDDKLSDLVKHERYAEILEAIKQAEQEIEIKEKEVIAHQED